MQQPGTVISDLAITDVAGGGDGIGHAPDGRIVFVAGGVIGDTVDVAVTEDKPRMLRGRVASVIEPSPDRVDPPCPHVAEGCGGCGWQHVDLDAQRRAKVRLAEETLRRIGHLEATVRPGPDLADTGYRNTVRLVATEGHLGFRAAASHDIVPVDSCLVTEPDLAELLASEAWTALADGTEVTLRAGVGGERLVLVHGARPGGWEVPGATVAAADDLDRDQFGPALTMEVDGVALQVSIASFFQTRTDGAQVLVDTVRAVGGDVWESGHLIDLYGGVGLFAATLGRNMSVTLVESAPSSVADARRNLSVRGHRAVSRRVEQWTPSERDRSARVVVADPPRAGLHRSVPDVLAGVGPEVLVTVHCDAASHARDAGRLVEAGFDLDDVVLVDLFPHTPHVELVSRFTPTNR